MCQSQKLNFPFITEANVEKRTASCLDTELPIKYIGQNSPISSPVNLIKGKRADFNPKSSQKVQRGKMFVVNWDKMR